MLIFEVLGHAGFSVVPAGSQGEARPAENNWRCQKRLLNHFRVALHRSEALGWKPCLGAQDDRDSVFYVLRGLMCQRSYGKSPSRQDTVLCLNS